MNDFTKGELILLAESIPYLLHIKTNARTDLLIKIDSMIDNYCEHISDGRNTTPKCLKCGEFYR